MTVRTEVPSTLTIEELRQKYADGRLTPGQVVREIVERAHRDAEMNIWITPPEMEAVRPFLDKLELLDPSEAPLWGIPFAVKDNIDVAGMLTTAGCPDFAYTPAEHASVVERLAAAGAIPLGKTNLDQFATGLVGTRSPYGETHNALRPELISGGSSSGSAVAVARGHAAFALGTDTAGSGRVPAALHGLVGFKPSVGAWPTKGVVPACASIDCVTVFAHGLIDALAVDAVVRGPQEADPWSRSVPASASALPSKLVLPKRPQSFFGSYAEAYRKAWEEALEKASGLGIPIVYADTDIFAQAAAILYEGPWVAERWADLGGFVDGHSGSLFPVTEQVLRSGASERYDAASVFRAMHRLQVLKLEAFRLLEDAVMILPTCGGTWTRDEVRADPIGTNQELGRYTNHCNLLDMCAVAIPAGDAAPDMPFGITLFAPAGGEGLVCGTAAALLGTALPAPAQASQGDTTLVAVCGLHMRGLPLERQMLECGARFIAEAVTAPKYRLVKLPTSPVKPGLVKQAAGGGAIRLELWEMPTRAFGAFAAAIPAPLGIGKVELGNGEEVPGFVCEAYAAASMEAEDITAYGGWRQYSAANSSAMESPA